VGYKSDYIPAEATGKLTFVSTGKEQILLHFLSNIYDGRIHSHAFVSKAITQPKH